jgi:uncharacterized protein (TIGR00730 family)
LITARGDATFRLMPSLTSLCVYCGSGPGTNPAYEEAARILGRAMADSGVRLVYGGGSVGLMGTVARAVLDGGGSVTGIIPRFLQSRERPMADLSELIVTDDMHQRKMLMFERADAFAALPGGVGTLEELVEQMTWAQLGRHEKPVLLANIAGFWDPLVKLLDEMRRVGFIRADLEVSCVVANRAEEILPMLERTLAARPRQELEAAASIGQL